MHPFPFIVGCERSGTTLLRAMIGAHPAIAIPGESYFIPEMLRQEQRFSPNGTFDEEEFLSQLQASDKFRRWDLPVSSVRTRFASAPPGDLPSALRATFAAYAAQHGKSRGGDKTPRYVLEIPALARAFPEACFIHIVRDGRDVALSLLARDHEPPNTLGEAVLMWRRAVTVGRRAGAELGPDRYVEVSYEALVADPEANLRRLCAFIDITYDECMQRYFDAADSIVGSFDRPDQHARIFEPPSIQSTGWRQHMSESDLALVALLAGRTLRTFGYEVARARFAARPARTALIAVARHNGGLAIRLGRRLTRSRVPRHRSGESADRRRS